MFWFWESDIPDDESVCRVDSLCVYSSIGRATVSKTVGSLFDSEWACQAEQFPVATAYGAGLRKEMSVWIVVLRYELLNRV